MHNNIDPFNNVDSNLDDMARKVNIQNKEMNSFDNRYLRLKNDFNMLKKKLSRIYASDVLFYSRKLW